MSGRNLTLILIGVLTLFVLSNALYIIKETERGVLLRFGEVVNPDVPPGLHVKIPFVNNVRKFDARVLTVDALPERFLTLEKKALVMDSYAKWRVSDVAKYYTATGGDESRANGLLAQRINDGLRNQVGVRTLQEVVSGERDQLMTELLEKLNAVARDELGVKVVDVRVKKIDLPPSVSDAVFRRMNAEREKEARELRSQGRELAEGIRAAADREVTVIKAGAYRPIARPSRARVTCFSLSRIANFSGISRRPRAPIRQDIGIRRPHARADPVVIFCNRESRG